MQKLNQSRQILKSLKFHSRVAILSKIIMNFTLKYMTRKSLFKHDQSHFISEYVLLVFTFTFQKLINYYFLFELSFIIIN